MATITITVTVANPGSGNKYYLNGVLQATYVATPGNTYKFDQADGSNSGHPLRLSITSDGTHNSGSAYTTGVTTSGTPGSAGAYTQIEVTATTVQALYYYCTNHSGMGGSFNTGSSATVQFQDRKGFDVQNLSSDSTSVGQLYYNTTSGQFKGILDGGAPIGTWASGGDLSGGKRHLGGAGYATAGLVFGGNAPSAVTAQTESYNGTAWSEVADLDNARNYVQGAGYQTAALAIAGSPPSTAGYTESWNGSAWSEVAALSRGSPSPQSDVYGMGCGIQTSALYFGGDEGSTNVKALNESWNGSSWSEEADMNVAKSYGVGIATSNQSAISAGGLDWAPGSSRNTPSNEEWNGSSWTEIAELNQGRGFLGGSSLGSTTNTIVFGGRNQGPSAIFTLTEFYNGTTWTEVADMATTTQSMGYSGTPGGSGTFSAGGQTPSTVAKTEEFVAADFQVKTLTTS